MTVDLNSDMGELADASIEEALMRHVTSANVACGGHAGDEASMRRTVELARRYGVAIGAHPSYPDRDNFGRLELRFAPEEIESFVFEQVRALARVADELSHVKPHGALYNVAARDVGVARAIARGVGRWSPELVLVGLAGSRTPEVWRDMGFAVAAEAFADRRYEPDGSLRSRRFPDALITDPAEAAAQALRLVSRAETICIHSDTPDAPRITAAVAAHLRSNGVIIQALRARRAHELTRANVDDA